MVSMNAKNQTKMGAKFEIAKAIVVRLVTSHEPRMEVLDFSRPLSGNSIGPVSSKNFISCNAMSFSKKQGLLSHRVASTVFSQRPYRYLAKEVIAIWRKKLKLFPQISPFVFSA
uniref:Uncharacterized protein n=1 Tax=Romanomermis culicivorax TaxID=13658 RepID=A0A915KZR6_ROMCU